MLKFRDLSTTLLRQHTPAVAPVKVDESVPKPDDLPKGWRWEDAEKSSDETAGLVQVNEGDEGDGDSDALEDDEEDAPEDAEPESEDFDPQRTYGIDLHNPTLLDLLSDQAIRGAETPNPDQGDSVTTKGVMGKTLSSAKKNTSGVNLEEY